MQLRFKAKQFDYCDFNVNNIHEWFDVLLIISRVCGLI